MSFKQSEKKFNRIEKQNSKNAFYQEKLYSQNKSLQIIINNGHKSYGINLRSQQT